MKSMTGFGRAELLDEEKKITVEMKSVNHRYLDINMRMPKKLSVFEAAIRTLLKEYIQRGKVDLFVTYEDYTQSRVSVKYNQEIAGQYLEYLRQIGDTFHLDSKISAAELSRYPEVFTMEEQTQDEKELWSFLEETIRRAAIQFVETRTKEGAHLRQDILEKLHGMEEKVQQVENRSPEILREYREKLETKVKELLADTQMEESRIAAEVIFPFCLIFCKNSKPFRYGFRLQCRQDQHISVCYQNSFGFPSLGGIYRPSGLLGSLNQTLNGRCIRAHHCYNLIHIYNVSKSDI